MTGLRKLHLVIGFTLVPFLLVTATTGIIYLLMPRFHYVLRWHSWFTWGGLVLAAGLAFLAISGAILYLSMRIQQWKRRARMKAATSQGPTQTA
ncbi:hypothetical protein JXD38_09095 [candidate division WOR-3 bacterium]|nr:hypothetical protein [candidate division WOR-3 bacterium]